MWGNGGKTLCLPDLQTRDELISVYQLQRLCANEIDVKMLMGMESEKILKKQFA
jgi:hypothetical protein